MVFGWYSAIRVHDVPLLLQAADAGGPDRVRLRGPRRGQRAGGGPRARRDPAAAARSSRGSRGRRSVRPSWSGTAPCRLAAVEQSDGPGSPGEDRSRPRRPREAHGPGRQHDAKPRGDPESPGPRAPGSPRVARGRGPHRVPGAGSPDRAGRRRLRRRRRRAPTSSPGSRSKATRKARRGRTARSSSTPARRRRRSLRQEPPLVPFGEYVPFGDVFPDLYPDGSRTQARCGGERVGADPFGGHALAVLICYEDTLPAYANAMMAGGRPDLLINLNNDIWFGTTAASAQHFALSKLRAVEHHRFLVRARPTSVSRRSSIPPAA